MIRYLLPFLAVMLGYAGALWIQPKNKKGLKLLLAFSGAFLLSMTVIHLLPEVYSDAHAHDHGHEHEGDAPMQGNIFMGLCIMAGILLQIVLEYFSQGAEHGHTHGHGRMAHIPWALFISLCFHAFLEGLVIVGTDMAYGIAVHHLPIAVILTGFFVNSHLGRGAIFAFMLTFAAMTPLGTLLSDFLPTDIDALHRPITAVVIGVLFHISSTIIFEASENHKFNVAKMGVILLGIALAAFF